MTDDALHRRIQYETDGIDVDSVDPDPIVQFGRWFADAAAAVGEANAMILSTTGGAGPSSRAVLLREFRDGAFVFYTNRRSRKATEIAADDRVALLFPWFSIHRQVRVEGRARPAPDEVSDRYFAARPRASQAAAAASPQSEPIPDRAWLERRVEQVLEQETIERPAHWGGYVVEPDSYEFWQGRSERLHDRLRYRRDGGTWRIERLAP